MNQADWNSKWEQNQTGWDIGYVSTPIREYIDQLENKNLNILIPGSGNSYEGEYLFKKGFTNITLLDYSNVPFENLRKRCPEFPKNSLVNGDFFKHKGKYDLIIEQTFFSSFKPQLRKLYAEKIHDLLKPGGKLVGLLFGIELYSDHPPFGGDTKEYRNLFSPWFKINTMKTAYNSIEPRMGNEIFMILEKLS
jgi:SAM-dependent methyltransferase